MDHHEPFQGNSGNWRYSNEEHGRDVTAQSTTSTSQPSQHHDDPNRQEIDAGNIWSSSFASDASSYASSSSQYVPYHQEGMGGGGGSGGSSQNAYNFDRSSSSSYSHQQQPYNPPSSAGAPADTLPFDFNQMTLTGQQQQYQYGGPPSMHAIIPPSLSMGSSSAPDLVGASSGSTIGAGSVSTSAGGGVSHHHYSLSWRQGGAGGYEQPQQPAGVPPPGFSSHVQPLHRRQQHGNEDDNKSRGSQSSYSTSNTSRSNTASGGGRGRGRGGGGGRGRGRGGGRNNPSSRGGGGRGRSSHRQGRNHPSSRSPSRDTSSVSSYTTTGASTVTSPGDYGDDASATTDSRASSEALRLLMTNSSLSSPASSSQVSQTSTLTGYRLNLEEQQQSAAADIGKPILPTMEVYQEASIDYDDDTEDEEDLGPEFEDEVGDSPGTKRREWLLRMNRKLQDIPIGELDPAVIPVSAIMNSWAKTKSAHGAGMVEQWLNRAQQEYDAGNPRVVPTTKMYTMAGKHWLSSVGLVCILVTLWFSKSSNHLFVLLDDLQLMLGRKVAKGDLPHNELRRSCSICTNSTKRLQKKAYALPLGFLTL